MSDINKFFKENLKLIFLLLTLATGAVLLFIVSNCQSLLAQGDHGRDLYAFKKAMDGAVTYKDYWWPYGPLMPYYYGLFLKLFGISIKSILIGRAVLILGISLFFYLTLATLIPPSFAFIATIWALNCYRDFFYTYNHIGGLVTILACVYFLFSYMQQQKLKYLYLSLLCIFLTSLIKINYGFASLFNFLIAVFLIDSVYKTPFNRQKIKFYLCALIILPITILAVYYFLLHELPIYYIRQCLPYLGGDQPHEVSLQTSSRILVQSIFNNALIGWPNRCFAILILLSLIQTITLIFNKKTDRALKSKIILTLAILSIFYLVNLHEFLKSAVYYRTFWSTSFSMMLIFIVIYFGVKNLSRSIQILFIFTILFTVTIKMIEGTKNLRNLKTPEHYIAHPRTQIYVSNPPQWIQTVVATTNYLEQNVKKDELFFALPYDPLYYFLTDKDSPTRQLIFFNHIKIPTEQEKTIIAELEKNNVTWVVMSSRSQSKDPTLGVFGETYCPLLGEYIKKHFAMTIEFGDWKNEPGWIGNHGTRILKRVSK